MAKVTAWIETELEFDAVRLVCEPRYADEDCPGIPFLNGDLWDVTIDLLPGGGAKIRNWPGPEFKLFTKVCDCCSAYLLKGDEVVLSRENDYVPGFMPGEHYGDYVILDIAEDGTLTNWKAKPDWQSMVPDSD